MYTLTHFSSINQRLFIIYCPGFAVACVMFLFLCQNARGTITSAFFIHSFRLTGACQSVNRNKVYLVLIQNKNNCTEEKV